MKWRAEAFSDFGSPSGSTTLLLSKVPDVCSDLGTKTDCTSNPANGCVWSDATGMCMKDHEEGFSASSSVIDCTKINDCSTCAAESGCGWCKKTGKCLNTDRFGTSAGRCTPESQFATFPSGCAAVPTFSPDSSTLFSNSASSASASASSEELPDTPQNRSNCINFAGLSMPSVTNPELRRQFIEMQAKCNTLMNKTDADMINNMIPPVQRSTTTSSSLPMPISKDQINVKFSYDEIPSFNGRIKSDIQRLMKTIGI